MIATPCVRDRAETHIQRLRVGDRQILQSLRGSVDSADGVVARQLTQGLRDAEIEGRFSPLHALADILRGISQTDKRSVERSPDPAAPPASPCRA